MNNKKICAIVLSAMLLSGFFAIARAESNEPVEYDQPNPVPLDDRWGNDVRIGDIDSVCCVSLDIHRPTSHIMAACYYYFSNQTSINMYFSTNGGASWIYKANPFVANGILPNPKLSLTTTGNHYYLAVTSWTPHVVRVFRFRVSDGAQVNFNNGAQYIDVVVTNPGDTIKEIALVSDHDFDDYYQNLFAITKNGSLKYFYSDTAGVNWYEIQTNVTNASRGLDACTNEGYSNYYAWVTYITNSDSIQIDGFDFYGNRTGIRTFFVGPNARFTSVGAYRDTIIAVYERSGTAVAYYCRYATSYNGGSSWTWGIPGGEDTTYVACCPDVAARDNGGESVIYAYNTGSSRRFRYTWRDYHGSWSTPIQFGDYQPPNNIKPAIEYLGNGRYGCIYVSYSPIYGAAYFDRSDWTGIIENDKNSTESNKFAISPNPSNGMATISFSIKKAGNVKISLYDISGRLVRTIVNERKHTGGYTITLNTKEMANGIYLVKMETPEGTLTKTIAIIQK